jgi:hypothetical protein
MLLRMGLLAVFLALTLPLFARGKDATQYGAGLIVNLTFSEQEVTQAVEDVTQSGIIRGTKEYNKDEYITGAVAAGSTKVFPEAIENGKVFYKIRLKTIDPRNFKDSGDVGTLAVRYVVQAQGEKNTVLRIDARFVEDFRHTMHPSNGSVESAEYKDIHDRLDALELTKSETIEALKEKQEQLARKQNAGALQDASVSQASVEDVASTSASSGAAAQAQPQTLEEKIHNLRQQVERRVKAPGAPLKSAPFHTASTLQSLPAGTEVLIVITTPYWLGVETHDGQHGWMLRDDLEFVQ